MKGQKTGGRVKGVPNRTSLEIRQALIDILNNNLDRLQGALETMDDKECAKLLVSLGKHLTFPEVSPERLTEDQLKQILEYIRNEQNRLKTGN
jgi:hypothetical protein